MLHLCIVIAADEIDAVALCCHPLTVGRVEFDIVDAQSVEQIVSIA